MDAPLFPFPQSTPYLTSELICRGLLFGWAILGWGWIVFTWRRTPSPLRTQRYWLLFLFVGVVVFAQTMTPSWRDDRLPLAGMLAISLAALVGGTRTLVQTETKGDGIFFWIAINVLAMCAAVPFLFAFCGAGQELLIAFPCHHKLKGISLALWDYADQHEQTLPPTVEGEPEVSWRVAILPYLYEGKSPADYDPAQPWDAPANLAAAKTRTGYYTCAANLDPADDQGRYYTAFAALTGDGTAFPRGKQVRIRDIKDGTSNTALIVESCGQRIIWTEPRDLDVHSLPRRLNQPGKSPGTSHGLWSAYHVGHGAFTLLADGSVRPIHQHTSPEVLDALVTIDGGEKRPEW